MSHTNENVIPPPADLRDSPSPSPSENEILPSYEELSAISSDLNSPRRSSAEQIKLYNGVEMKISISGNKTYRPGDTIHGSAILHNHNSEPLSIDGVLISLIGLQTVTNMRNPIKPITVNQKIIDMADTETFNETKNLTLRPNETLERPFAFVVPQYILDTYCPHQIADHLHIPPSFDGDEGRSVYGQKIVYKIRAEIDPVNLFVLEKVYICSDHTAFPKSSHSSTVDQLKLAEKYAEKEIETTSYKINLRNLGIRSINEQNDLIHHDLMTKNKSEFQDFMKLDSPTSEKLEFLVSNEVSSTIDMPRKSSSGLFNFSKQETDKVYIVIDGDSHLVGSKIDVKLFTFAEKPPAIEMLKFQPILYSVNYQSHILYQLSLMIHFCYLMVLVQKIF